MSRLGPRGKDEINLANEAIQHDRGRRDSERRGAIPEPKKEGIRVSIVAASQGSREEPKTQKS